MVLLKHIECKINHFRLKKLKSMHFEIFNLTLILTVLSVIFIFSSLIIYIHIIFIPFIDDFFW